MSNPETEHEEGRLADENEPSAQNEGAAEEPTLEEQLAAAITERDANYQRVLRSQAELENYRKRAHKEMQEARLYQALPIIRDLLPGLDNLERAIEAAEKTSDAGELVQGVQMVAKQFADFLSRQSAEPITAVGEAFDPNLHEAIQQLPSSDHPPMTVIQEVERGYTLNGRVIRPSKVIVSSGPPVDAADTGETAQ